MSDKEIPEVKRLRWLAIQFPIVKKPKDDVDRMQSCIYLYCTAAADLIERQKKEIDQLKAEVERERHLNDKRRMDYGNIRAEAFKEFAGKVNEKINHYYDRQSDIDQDDEVADAVRDYLSYLTMDVESILDELLKEEA